MPSLRARYHLFRLKRARRSLKVLERGVDRLSLGELSKTRTLLEGLDRGAAKLSRAITTRDARASASLPTPPERTDWQHIPDLWLHRISPNQALPATGQTRLGEAEIYHDAHICETVILQTAKDAGLGVTIDTLGFDGSYLSLAIAAPPSILTGLTKQTLIGARLTVRSEKPASVYLRANVRHGPNTARMVRSVDPQKGQQDLEFDIFHTDIVASDVTDIWFDFVLENAAMNMVEISAVQLYRRTRAQV